MKTYEYDAVIQASEVGRGGAYVIFPYDIRAKIGKQVGDSIHVTIWERE